MQLSVSSNVKLQLNKGAKIVTKVEKRTRVNEEKETQRRKKKERETVNENRERKKGPGIVKRRIFQKGTRENSWKNREDVFIQVLLTSE